MYAKDQTLAKFLNQNVTMIGPVRRTDPALTARGQMARFIMVDGAVAKAGCNVGERLDHTVVRHPYGVDVVIRPGDLVKVTGKIIQYKRLGEKTTGYGLETYETLHNVTTGTLVKYNGSGYTVTNLKENKKISAKPVD
jgi:hypothetical protein